MKERTIMLALPLALIALGLGACQEAPVAPDLITLQQQEDRLELESTMTPQQRKRPGTGLELESLTGLAVPLIGELGEVVIDQAVITNLTLVENAVGQIIGVEAEGVLQLTGGVLGTDVVTEDFTTTLAVTSSGPGQCELVTLDLGTIDVDALGLASIDVPEADLTARGSGAVGSLLCNLGNLLEGLGAGGLIPGAQGIVNAINNRI